MSHFTEFTGIRRAIDDVRLALAHLQPGGDERAFLASLRLQNLDRLDVEQVQQMAEQAGKPKLRRAALRIAEIVAEEAEAYEPL